MDDIDRLLCIKLYDVMDKVGVSEKIRKLRREIAIRIEIITSIKEQIKNDKKCTTFIFGSHSEGTTTIGLKSDIDHVFCHHNYSVIDDIRAAQHGCLTFLMVRDNHTYPGYVKLQMVYDRTPSTIYNAEFSHNHIEPDNKGRFCRKPYPCDLSHDHEIHGPASTVSGKEGKPDKDFVGALRCWTIPKYAQAWLHRRRQCNWPSCDNLHKMCDLGCFVVGVGHSSSREQHLEWRLSFSLQERILMFSLNPTQHKCYVLLKIIKNDIVKAEIADCLSSYHCKTCLFYALEFTPARIWRPANIVCCVRLCLMILLTWVVNGVCPNYFIPSENMFEKPQFHANRYRLLDLLKAIIADENSIILRMQCDDIRSRILKPGRVQNNMTDNIVYSSYINFYSEISRFSKDMYIWAHDCSVTCPNIFMVLAQNIDFFQNMRVIDEYSEHQTSDALSFVIPVLHLHIAHRLACLACKSQDQEHVRQLLYLSIYHFQQGKNADLMTSRLLVVSLLFRLKKYELCEIILKDIEHDLKIYIVTECGCYDRRYSENIVLTQHLSTNNVSCKTAIKTVFADCVRFARCDTEIAPLPLQYEMYRSMGTPPGSRDEYDDEWFDWAAVDGKVYLYFLQYMVYSRVNRPANQQKAIVNIVRVLGDDPNLMHSETALNLLGWIHTREGRIPEALRCFVTSWRIRPVHNAAKWHLCIALHKYYTRK